MGPLRTLLAAVAAVVLLIGAELRAQWDPNDLVAFQLSRETVQAVTLGATEPDQDLTLVRIVLTTHGVEELARLTAANIGKGLLIEMPDGRQFGPNRIEKALGGNRLGLVLPSDVAEMLKATLGRNGA